MTPPTVQSKITAPEKIYDALNAARTADCVNIRLKDGRPIQGSLVFNPFKGGVRVIDIEQETSIDFPIDHIAELRFI